ncbi:MAG: hypothetical protein R3242_06245 [Akkermansiaceae bacterium]|nr:hypothetical protein [Akkermansiaceae bacterium]
MSEPTEPDQASNWDTILLLLLRLAASTVFLGRGILYLSKFSPLSAFFWHQDWLEEPLAKWFGMSWEHYAATSEPLIIGTQNALGVLFLLCAVLCWWVGPKKRIWPNWIVLIGVFGLIPFWLLSWVDKNYQSGMFLEHFLQWGTPLLLVLYGRMSSSKWFALAWVFTSFTFIGHGQYAIGLGVPYDNNYVNMCIRLLRTDEEGARLFLAIVGWIDVVLPILFLIPKARIPALGYATFWGLVTALSRIPSHFTRAQDYYGLHPWTAEAVVRLTHGLIPLVMLLLILRARRQHRKGQAADRAFRKDSG